MAGLAGAGDLPPGDDVVHGTAGDREQGAEVVLQVRVTAGRAQQLRFRAFGCPHFLAAASWLTERLCGAGRAEFADWDWREAARALEVPPAKYGRMLVLQDVVHAVAGNWPGDGQSTV